MTYILSVKGDCNDGDYMTENTKFDKEKLGDLRKVRDILRKLIGINEHISEYDNGYNNDVIVQYITMDELSFIAKFMGWADDEIKFDLEDVYCFSDLFDFFPIEGQSGQMIHSVEEVKILQEII